MVAKKASMTQIGLPFDACTGLHSCPGACPQLARVVCVPKHGRALMQNSLKRMWALLGMLAALAAILAAQATAAHKAVTIVIWTDSDRAAAVTKVAGDWAASNGATIKVVTKNF